MRTLVRQAPYSLLYADVNRTLPRGGVMSDDNDSSTGNDGNGGNDEQGILPFEMAAPGASSAANGTTGAGSSVS